MTMDEFEQALKDVNLALPIGVKTLRISFRDAKSFQIWTGTQTGPRSGQGVFYKFEKLKGIGSGLEDLGHSTSRRNDTLPAR